MTNVYDADGQKIGDATTLVRTEQNGRSWGALILHDGAIPDSLEILIEMLDPSYDHYQVPITADFDPANIPAPPNALVRYEIRSWRGLGEGKTLCVVEAQIEQRGVPPTRSDHSGA